MGAFDYPTVDVIREVLLELCEYTSDVDGTKITGTVDDVAAKIDQRLRAQGYMR